MGLRGRRHSITSSRGATARGGSGTGLRVIVQPLSMVVIPPPTKKKKSARRLVVLRKTYSPSLNGINQPTHHPCRPSAYAHSPRIPLRLWGCFRIRLRGPLVSFALAQVCVRSSQVNWKTRWVVVYAHRLKGDRVRMSDDSSCFYTDPPKLISSPYRPTSPAVPLAPNISHSPRPNAFSTRVLCMRAPNSQVSLDDDSRRWIFRPVLSHNGDG